MGDEIESMSACGEAQAGTKSHFTSVIIHALRSCSPAHKATAGARVGREEVFAGIPMRSGRGEADAPAVEQTCPNGRVHAADTANSQEAIFALG